MILPPGKKIPDKIKEHLQRIVRNLGDPSQCEGKIVTIVGYGFRGDLHAKGGRWLTKPGKFWIHLVSSEQEK